MRALDDDPIGRAFRPRRRIASLEQGRHARLERVRVPGLDVPDAAGTNPMLEWTRDGRSVVVNKTVAGKTAAAAVPVNGGPDVVLDLPVDRGPRRCRCIPTADGWRLRPAERALKCGRWRTF